MSTSDKRIEPMKNLFETAKYGDVFFTRGGNIVLFHHKDDRFAYMQYYTGVRVAVDVNTGRWVCDKETHADIIRKIL